MASIEKTLSARANESGKCQLMVRIIYSHSLRLRYKSGVFVTPEFWDIKKQSVVVPRLGRLNKAAVEVAKKELAQVEDFLRDFTIICDIARESGRELDAKWVDRCFTLRPFMDSATDGKGNRLFLPFNGSIFTLDNIERAESLKDQEEKRAQEEESKKEQNRKLYEVIPDYCKAHDLAPSRVKVYMVLQRLLARYEMFERLKNEKKGKKYSLSLSSLCTKDIEDFREYMRNEGSKKNECPEIFDRIVKEFPLTENTNIKNRPIADRGENYVVVTMKRLKAVVNWCIETGRMSSNPFKGVEIGAEKYGTPIYISKEERNIIADFDLSGYSKTIQEQRDIFIFQCLVGCRVSDLYSLTEANIDFEKGMLKYSPKKTEKETGIIARVPLTERAKQLIAKYRDESRKTLFPFISEQRYNDTIKEIFAICGITRNVVWRNPTTGSNEIRPINEIASSHLARRTFVGGIYKQVQDPNMIGAMSGHTEGSRAFARYRDIDDETLNNNVGLID